MNPIDMTKLFLFIMIVVFPPVSSAFCWELAGERYNLNPSLLKAIAKVESGLNSKAYGYNTNGSRDIGLMQINSTHLNILKKNNITEEKLISDPCLNVMTGAWILSNFIQRTGYNWNAVGAYNAGLSSTREKIRRAYARRVWQHYIKFVAEENNGDGNAMGDGILLSNYMAK